MTKKNQNVKRNKRQQSTKQQVKQRVKRRYRNRSIPAARTKTNRAYLRQVRSGNSVRVTGYDLIYNTSEGIIEGPFCAVSCNPAYWTGTRIATIANSYSQYRPISMRFDYYPQVSTMNNGNVITGTLWNNNSTTNNLQQTLATSNGGKMFPVYSNQRIPINLKTNLSQNLFDFQGYLDSNTNPFIFIANTQQANNIIPGYFMVHYTFEFKNPIGEGYEYDTEVKTAGEVTKDDVWETTTGVLLSSTTTAAIGTKLILKVVDGAVQYFLGGSRIGMVADLILKLFKSRPKTITKMDENIINLQESNRITFLQASLDFIERGSSVTMNFVIGEPLTLDHFITIKQQLSGADYDKIGGLFAKLEQVGPGRYNIGFVAIHGTTENYPTGWYCLRTLTTPTDYSMMNTSSNTQDIEIKDVRVRLQYQNDSPIECIIPVFDSFTSAQPNTLADIALLDVQSVLGISEADVVGGTTDRVLVPLSRGNTQIIEQPY